MSKIKVVGAREHNLKNISVDIPKNQLVVITGPSGSGKSSLALDILYAEGKRRYMESLSSYARQFLGIAAKPDFDSIEGLCPAIAIEQKTVGNNPRSTVGTITEIYDYLRVLCARIGTPHCVLCKKEIQSYSATQIAQYIIHAHKGKNVTIVAPLVRERKGEFKNLLVDYLAQGFFRFIVDGVTYKFAHVSDIEKVSLKKTERHTIDMLIDNVTVDQDGDTIARIQEAVQKSFNFANGIASTIIDGVTTLYSATRSCLDCGTAFPELEPRFFSFNSPVGACKGCDGLGAENLHEEDYSWYVRKQEIICRQCNGQRLNKQALAVTIGGKNIFEIGQLSVQETYDFFKALKLDAFANEIAKSVLHEVCERLKFLIDVGLDYLTLNRSARTLSGGEGQRIRLAKQVGCALSGVLYILDEPSIGLHQKDNDRLIATLQSLKKLGNSVIVVEHDLDTMLAADYIIDMGPGAGVHGGMVTAAGTAAELMKDPNSLTGQYLSKKLQIKKPKEYRTTTQFLTIHNATKNNLKNITVTFPLHVLCAVSGVSGSGKSSLIFDELLPLLQKQVGKSKSVKIDVDDRLEGAQLLENIVQIDQTPIGKTSRSNPATYIGIFNDIRALFASMPESKARGYDIGQFSFNVAQGRCFKCHGEGIIKVSMHFLPDVIMVCKACQGKKYSPETLQILFKGKNIYDVLEMTAAQAVDFFAAHSGIVKRLKLMCDVGLDYIKLGQPSTTLSGGEAQRIKLVTELAKRGHNSLYILDEPTTGLHNHDIVKLINVFNRLIDKGNSIIVIEHNLDVLKVADYIIDLGPAGGIRGGQVIAQGTPDQLAQSKESVTGLYLKKVLCNK